MNIVTVKRDIYNAILVGDITINIIKKLTKGNGEVISKECELWDFKESFDGSKDAYLKLLKSIVSFHNTYGGYIIYGISEKIKDSLMVLTGSGENLINQQSLRGQFDKYFGRRIDLTYSDLHIEYLGNTINIGLLHIPKRGVKEPTISPIIDGANGNNDKILAKDHVYFRKADECKSVISFKDFEFIASDRNFHSENKNEEELKRKKIIEHNLPDKNYICPIFIGRFDIIQELWAWLSDEFQYAKILAADGGKGKTSIAYEFSQLLVSSGSELFEQVIWLTAKTKQFKAIYNDFITSPEVHFHGVESLLKQICIRTGSLEEELADLSIHQLQRIAKDNLLHYRSLIIIDDVDSNSIDEQRRIMDMARVISNPHSRILLTTRVNNIYSLDSSILVPGLSGDDYKNLIKSLTEQLKLPSYNDKNTKKLEIASEGSPLFTESILRLCKLGMSIDDAITEWDGKSGEAVRIAALRKEVSELSQESIKIIITTSYIGSCSRIELHQYTELEDHEISNAIEELGSLFLIRGISFIESEPRFETSSSISKLIISIAHEILPNANEFLTKISEVSLGLEANLRTNIPEVGSAIRQCNSLLKEKRFDDSREVISNMIKQPRYKENADLYFMLAKSEYEDENSKPEIVRKSFSDAFIKGQRKSIFFEMWYQTEKKHGNKNSIYDVCKTTIENIQTYDAQWTERYALACYEMSLASKTDRSEMQFLLDCYENINKVIKSFKPYTYKWQELKEISKKVIDRAWIISKESGDHISSATIISQAINAGDIRSLNFKRLIEVSSLFKLKKTENITDTQHELIECFSKSLDILNDTDNPRKELLSLVDKASVDFLNSIHIIK